MQALRFAWPRSQSDCLDIESLAIMPGEKVFIHGPSGCGKSTLLSLMAGVLSPRQGQVSLCGKDWQSLPVAARDRHRVDHVGYIFQQFNLLPYLSVIDNVLLPCRFSRSRHDAAVTASGAMQDAAAALLLGMGLARELWHRDARALSVGQQQRVATARALIGSPAVVIADEPTSALDEALRETFLDLLMQACAQAGSALVLVSHDHRIAARFDRKLSLPEINRAAAIEAAA